MFHRLATKPQMPCGALSRHDHGDDAEEQHVRGAVLAQRLQQGEVDDRAEQRALDGAKPPITTMKIA